MNPYLFSLVLLIGLGIETALYIKLYVNSSYNIFSQL